MAICGLWKLSTFGNRFFDPVFSIGVGFSAAALRIQREQREKHREQNSDFPTLWAKGVRRAKIYFGGEGGDK